jgi:hypothetical protein
MYLCLGAGLICLILSLRSVEKKEASRREAARTVTRLTEILSGAGSRNETTARNSPTEIAKPPLYQIQAAYLELDLRRGGGEIPQPPLIVLANCLRSKDQALKTECQSLARTLLSDWVFGRNESDWHSRPEIDLFFKIFKQSRSVGLAVFLKNRAVNFEQKYLNQI